MTELAVAAAAAAAAAAETTTANDTTFSKAFSPSKTIFIYSKEAHDKITVE